MSFSMFSRLNTSLTSLSSFAGRAALSASVLEQIISDYNPFDFVDASNSQNYTLSTTNITEIANLGSSGQPLTHESGAYMTEGEGGALCSGSQNNYQIGVAGDRNFLHDGTGCEWFFISKPDSTASSNGFPFYTNISGSSNAGAYLAFEPDEDIRWFTRGDGNFMNLDSSTQLGNGLLPLDTKCIVSGYNQDTATSTENESAILVNGAEAYGLFVGSGITYDTDDHSDPLRLCVSTKGIFCGWLAIDRKLTAEERADLTRLLRIYYGLLTEIDTYVFIGDSIMNGGAVNIANLDAAYANKVVPRSYIWGTRLGDTDTETTLRPLAPKNAQVAISNNPTVWGFGAELTALWGIGAADTDNEFLVLKQAKAGDVTSTKWLPEGDASNSWDDLVANKALFEAYLASIGVVPRYKAITTNLGTNDADTELRSGEYEDAMTDLITNARTLFSYPTMPVYMIKTQVEDPDSRNDAEFQYQDVVTTAQAAIVASDSNTILIDPNVVDASLSWRESTPNGIHYDEDAAEFVGLAVAALQFTPVNTIAPAVTGTTDVSGVLTADTGTWSGAASFTYQWFRDGLEIVSETANTYSKVIADDGSDITCLVTAANLIGSATKISNAISVVDG